MCYDRHAKHQEEATREDPEWQEQYADFKESELQNAEFAMLQFFDPDSYEQQRDAFAEEQKKLEEKQRKKQTVSARYKNQAGRIFRADEVQPRKRITVSRALRAKQKYRGFRGIEPSTCRHNLIKV